MAENNFNTTFSTFEQEYERRRPKPVMKMVPEPELLQEPNLLYSPHLWIFTPIALGSILLSGLRTYHSLEQLSTLELPQFEGAAGVIVVELAIIGFQIWRVWWEAARQGKDFRFNTRWLKIGVILAFACAAMTNLDSTLITSNVKEWMEIRGLLLSILLGPVIPLLGIIGGEVVGGLLGEHTTEIRQIREANRNLLGEHKSELVQAGLAWQDELDKWQAAMSRQYTRKQKEKQEKVKPKKRTRAKHTKPATVDLLSIGMEENGDF